MNLFDDFETDKASLLWDGELYQITDKATGITMMSAETLEEADAFINSPDYARFLSYYQ